MGRPLTMGRALMGRILLLKTTVRRRVWLARKSGMGDVRVSSGVARQDRDRDADGNVDVGGCGCGERGGDEGEDDEGAGEHALFETIGRVSEELLGR